MTVDSLAHRRLTIGLFIVVIGAIFVVNAYATGGVEGVAKTLLIVTIVAGASFVLERLLVRR
jgi:hypothetical protein